MTKKKKVYNLNHWVSSTDFINTESMRLRSLKNIYIGCKKKMCKKSRLLGALIQKKYRTYSQT